MPQKPPILALTLLFALLSVVSTGTPAEGQEPGVAVLSPLEIMLMEPPTASLADPASEPAVADSLEGMLEQSAPATICTEQCPGDPAFGIAPYTPNCYTQCTPCYEGGEICGFLCDGYGLECFPQGCGSNPSC